MQTWPVALLLVLSAQQTPGLESDDTVADAVYQRTVDTYRLNVDGTYAEVVEVDKRITSEQGVRTHGQKIIQFDDALQSVEVLDASTLTKDGGVLPVDQASIITKDSSTGGDAPMFSQRKVTVIIFPRVEVGATLRYRYRITQKTALFPGQFSTIEHRAWDFALLNDTTTVIAPKSITLHTQAVGVSGGSVVCPLEETDKQCFTWTLRNARPSVEEPGSVAATDYSPRIAVSTFRDWNDVADAYLKRAFDKSKVTAAIRETAELITKGIDDKPKQAEALYNWVSRNVRYVAVYLGAGGVVPHDAEQVLKNRYGDCKDHVVLLEALLAAKGIESHGVLISASNSYWLPEVATPSAFNHVITYIPSLDRYVDSTLQVAPFGLLARQERGKQGLHLGDLRATPRLQSLPSDGSEPYRASATVTMALDVDGNIKGVTHVVDKGAAEMDDRAFFANLQPEKEGVIASKLLAAGGEVGTGTFNRQDPRDLQSPFNFSATFTLPHFVNFPGPGAFVVPSGLVGLHDIRGIGPTMTLTERHHALAGCFDYSKHQEITLNLPKGLQVLAVPKDAKAMTEIGAYSSRYRLHGSELRVTRDLNFTPHTVTCSPDQYQQMRALWRDVDKDLRAQVLYK